jgi:hypothetical protein
MPTRRIYADGSSKHIKNITLRQSNFKKQEKIKKAKQETGKRLIIYGNNDVIR